MSDLTLIFNTPDAIDRLTALAFEYGPFLFALLYMLFIPIIASRMFIYLIKQHITDKGPRERALDNYNFYFRLSVWSGVFLVLCSVVWWFYWQSQLMQRDYVYQGTIVNAAEQDQFSQIAADQELYFFRRQIDDSVEWKFVIVTDSPLPKNYEIRVRYNNLKDKIGEGLGKQGGADITLKIPDRNKRAFSFQNDKNKGYQLVALSGVPIR